MPQQSSYINKAGVIGWPIGHSLSPRLHGFWLKHYNIAGSYEPIAVAPQDLAAMLNKLAAEKWRGVNVTVPHKESVLPLLASIDPAARRIGAVNLVTIDEQGRLHGRNTDAYGFTQNLVTSDYQTDKGAALVLGAGGAARAVLVALSAMGMTEIRLANRSPERAAKLAQEFASPQCRITPVMWADVPAAMPGIDLLVNATSLGMAGQPPLELSLNTLPAPATVTDLVYAPLETELLKQARQNGHRAIDGLGMLLHQARPSFHAFFGRDPDVTPELRRHVLAARTET